MTRPLRVLLLEDSEDDAMITLREVRRAGYDVTCERMESAEAMRAALRERPWDIIISDHRMPGFTSTDALAIYKESGLDIPFIIVSATIGEDVAVAAMKAGAHDYILKDNLARVAPAIERELREAEVRRERRRAEKALVARTRQLEAVRAVSAEIIRELDLTTLLDLIDRRAADLVGAASGAIFLWDESVQLLIPHAWHGLGDWMGGVRFRLGEGIAGTVAQRRQGLLVNDFRTSPYALPLFLQRTGITAVLAKPLLYHDRLLGVITISHQAPGRTFTGEDQVLLRLFADHAAIAIENARLYEQVKDQVATLEQRVLERTQELAAANQQLEAASRHKSEFLANMSHELRTPLNSILGFAQILLEQTGTVLSEKQTRYLTHIYNSGQHLLQLISDILDLSKVEAGKFVLQPEPLPVAAALEDILVIGRGLANKKGQTIETAIATDLPPVMADPVRFKQICFNLLSNAVKFTPERGTITVRAQRVPAIADFKLQIGRPRRQKAGGRRQRFNLQSQICNLKSATSWKSP